MDLPLQEAVTPGWGFCPKYVAKHDFKQSSALPSSKVTLVSGVCSQCHTGGRGTEGRAELLPGPLTAPALPAHRGKVAPDTRLPAGCGVMSVTAP